jgi:hypothetical protein
MRLDSRENRGLGRSSDWLSLLPLPPNTHKLPTQAYRSAAAGMTICAASHDKDWPRVQGSGTNFSQNLPPGSIGDSYDDDTGPRRQFACLPVKWAGLAIPDPTSSAELHHDSSKLLTSHVLAVFQGIKVF